MSDKLVNRRGFLARVGGTAAGAAALGVLGSSKAKADSDVISIPATQPNILIIMLDQLRYKELAQHTSTSYPLSNILPNITALQQNSVEFQNYFTAGTSCTPARASLLTGLYSPQTCMYVTQGNDSAPNLVPSYLSGSLVTGYPTFGTFVKGLSGFNATYGTSFQNYQTAWFGKWHLSDETEDDNSGGLQKYGFSEKIIPSPNGFPNEGINGQLGEQPGDGSASYDSDLDILNYFVANMPQFIGTQPWLAVVSLINPHDISNYPQYGLDYCQIPYLTSQITPNFTPLLPNAEIPVAAGQISPASTFPSLPAVYNSGSTASNTGSACSAYTGFLPASSVTGVLTLPTNLSDNLSDKPALQGIYQTDIQASTKAGTANTGDAGSFLNVYYWLARCADQLIGSPTPVGGIYSNTILGQLAYMLNQAGQDLSNTVIIFMSDHGEYGGAHNLYGKGGANYDEAINVPLFVQIPGVTGNRLRSQLCSSVDFFGLIAALATENFTPSGSTSPLWMSASVNPQLANREQLYKFVESDAAANVRILPGTAPDVGGFPYILHTTDEFWVDEMGAYDYAYGTSEAYHVVGLRTASYKLGTYTAWAVNQSTPGSINVSSVAAAGGVEFYDYATNLGELNNDYASYASSNPTFISNLSTAFSSVVNSELQAPLSHTFPSTGSSLYSTQQTAASNYNEYIDPPTGVSLSVTAFAKASPTQVTVSGANVQPGPILKVLNSSGATTLQRIQIPVGQAAPFEVTLTFPTDGTFLVVLLNPSLAPSNAVTVTVAG